MWCRIDITSWGRYHIYNNRHGLRRYFRKEGRENTKRLSTRVKEERGEMHKTEGRENTPIH